MKNNKIAIIGAGSAGVMAALRAVLNNDKVILYTGNAKTKKKARGTWVGKVHNVPGFSVYKKAIVDPNKITLDEIQESEFKNNIEIINETVSDIKVREDGSFTIESDSRNESVSYVVLATGVMDVQPEINGSIRPIFPYANVQLANYCLRCDGHLVHQKETIVLGHNTSAAWTAIILKERYDTLSLKICTNGEKINFNEETSKLISLYDIPIETQPIIDFNGNKREKKLEYVVLENGELVHTDMIFVSLGMIVYNDLALKLNVEVDDRGFIITNPKGETNIDNFYAVGDVEAGYKKQIYTGWDRAVDALDHINLKIRKERRNKRIKNSYKEVS